MKKKEMKKMKKDMLDLILAAGYLTIPQLQRLLMNKGHHTVGDCEFRAEDLNVILWGGLSEEFIGVISELSAEEKIRFHSAPKEIYWFEGVSPSHPTVSDLPQSRLEGDVLYPVLVTVTEAAAKNQHAHVKKETA